MQMAGTFWSLVPAIVAIVLALCTKEVYSSLFFGILIGGLFYAINAASGFTGFLDHVFSGGLVTSIADSYNIGILVFLVILGTMVALMNKAAVQLHSVTGQKNTLSLKLEHKLLQSFWAFLFSLMTTSTVLL